MSSNVLRLTKVYKTIYSSRCFAHTSVSQLKPYSDMPGPLRLPLIGNAYLVPLVFLKSSSEVSIWQKTHGKYGTIFRQNFGQTEIVHTENVDDIEKIFRNEGKYPRRVSVESWKRWREENKCSKGVLTEEGASWKRLRKTFDQPMLTQKFLSTYIDGFNDVGDDLIKNIEMSALQNNGLVPTLGNELFHSSIENIATVLYETRLGALSNQRSEETSKFIQAVEDVFHSTSKIFYTPKSFNNIFLRKWQILHDQGWGVVFNFTKKLIDNKIKEINEKGSNRERIGYLEYLASTDLSIDEIYGNIADIMFGAVDTTSVSMQWILYELTNNPGIQEELYDEVKNQTEVKTMDDISRFPFLKAFLKETLRLYPVAVVASRILSEDTELSGYLVPKNTTVLGNMYNIGRNKENFNDPASFKPHRWLRDSNKEQIHNFAWLPFGFGQRSCIGRRIFELEVYIMLSKIVRTFLVEKVESEPISPKLTGLITLSRPLNVRFTKRMKTN